MIFRITTNLIMAGCVLLAVICAAPFAKGQMKHEDYHPRWLRESWCCGEHDTRRVRVAYLPAGWHVVWIDNPPGYPVIRLTKPIPFDAAKMLRSKDGAWWASFQIKNGVATGFWFKSVGGELRPCIFGHGSGQ